MTPYPTVLLFLKAPRPGFVKTRLATDLGDEKACQIFKRLANMTLAKIPTEWPVHVFFTPEDAAAEMQDWLGATVRLHPQVDGDLGQRLEAASAVSFQEGATSVIFLGGDCPEFTSDHLHTAAFHLSEKRPVIGPALDGGYWLLGLSHHHPEVFRDIRWSSDTVLQTTLQRFSSLKLEPHLLESLEDVDDLPSWSRAAKKDPTLQTFA